MVKDWDKPSAMKLFPETSADYVRAAVFVVVLSAIGVAVAFIPGNLGKNLSSGVVSEIFFFVAV